MKLQTQSARVCVCVCLIVLNGSQKIARCAYESHVALSVGVDVCMQGDKSRGLAFV